jgi:hypothetical protein
VASVVSLRLPRELLDWSTEYARTRGVSRTDLLIQGLQSFREDCERGVPEIKARAAQQAKGSGSCPKNEAGHVWGAHRDDPSRCCVFCGRPGRGDATKEGGGNLAETTALRAAYYSTLKAPMESGTGKPEKIHGPRG